MTRKTNVVKRAENLLRFSLILLLVSGWMLSAYVMIFQNTLYKQEAMIHTARLYLEDKLFVRAANQYRQALRTYHTKNNITYESELLEIYREAGMLAEYYDLIDTRMKAGTASVGEYESRAKEYIETGFAKKALQVLEKGIHSYQDDELVMLYESIYYEYSPVSTTFQMLHMPSSDWYIPAYNGESWGYIGKNGRTILDFAYEEATCFSGNYAVVKINGTYTLIDKNGYWNAIDKNGLDSVEAISGKKLIGVKDGKYGIYSNTFSLLGDEMYEKAYLSDNGMIAVQKDGKWAILDKTLKKVTKFQFTDIVVNSKGQVFNKNYAVAADEGGYHLINQEGKPYFEARFMDAKGIEDGLFAVKDDSGKWGFANEKGEVVIDCQYEDALSFSDRLAAVKYAGEWGYINRYNKMMIEAKFKEAYPFLAGSALVADKQGNYHILTLKYYDVN